MRAICERRHFDVLDLRGFVIGTVHRTGGGFFRATIFDHFSYSFGPYFSKAEAVQEIFNHHRVRFMYQGHYPVQL